MTHIGTRCERRVYIVVEEIDALAEHCNYLTEKLDRYYRVRAQFNEKIADLVQERNCLWKTVLSKWVGKTFKRGAEYAVICDIPEEPSYHSGLSINVQQLPIMVFVYDPKSYIDVRKEPDGLGLMWPDLMHRADMPEPYKYQCGAKDEDTENQWEEIPQEAWTGAFKARCFQVRRTLLQPIISSEDEIM